MLNSDIKLHTRGVELKIASAATVSEDGYCLQDAKTILGA